MTLKNLIKRKIQSLTGGGGFKISSHAFNVVEPTPKNTKVLLGRMLARLNEQLPDNAPISAIEFQVFSQFGDDGIIQFLTSRLSIASRTFIEFGVEDYRESNTRFLLINNRWAGLVLDGDVENVAYIQQDIVSLYHLLQSKQAFITRENINKLICETGFPEEIGILSIDLDGVDYWVWEAITVVRPVIVIVEYNSGLGSDSYLTVPYQSDFRWRKNIPTDWFYWGASLGALTELGKKKGYDLFGCNSAGNNAYFIRQDRRGNLPKAEVAQAYVEGQFAFGRDEQNRFVRAALGRQKLVKGRKFIDVRSNTEVII
jgi:hypothetical protein